MKTYVCRACGQEQSSTSMPPEPIKWNDGHVCNFRLASMLCLKCQREVTITGFTNTCQCGADYNFAGQLLAHRSQWGEETGESLSDILRIK